MPTNRRGSPLSAGARVVLFVCVLTPAASYAVEKGSQQVSQFYGSFAYAIPIEVPPFHGLEPRLALAYSSEGRNGNVGVGWTLTGFSTIERANSGRGTPRFNASDIYLLDGQELVACVGGSVSPSCTSGGTHSTKIESYLKIRHDTTPSDTWTVWGKDGTRTIFSPIISVTGGIFRWGQTSVVDTKNNTVTYTWACVDGDCYPSQVDYQNSYRISFARESRDDQQSAAAYSQLTTMKYRIKTVFVSLWGTGFIRAYQLVYAYSALTGRSLLTSVKQFGKNLTINGDGTLSGAFFPEQTFTYQNDSATPNGKTFVGEAPAPPTFGTDDVVWANRINAYAVSPGNSLQKSIGGNAWDAGASSTRAIASGNGYAEVAVSTAARYMVGLSNGDLDANPWDIDFAAYNYYGTLYAYEAGIMYGPFGSAPAGATLRVHVDNNVITYRANGTVYYTSTRTPTYPLRVDTSLYDAWSTITGVKISGLLQDANYWCQGALLLTGDFNSDGRTDQLCYRSETQKTQVATATATGFQAPVDWLTNYAYVKPVVGDFNGDGKADIADGPDWNGVYKVITSNGSGFNLPATWGTASGTGFDGEGHPLSGSCSAANTVPGAGDFNGDGITDVSCREAGDTNIYIGLSNGNDAFSFSIFGGFACELYEQTGAIDFDGDGKDDWFCIGMTNHNLMVFPSTGSSFLWPAFGSLGPSFCDQPNYILGDLNGDGRTDAACRYGQVALSNGKAFMVQGNYLNWCSGSTNFFAADVDGDGASELVCNLLGSVYVRKWRGVSQGLGSTETWKSSWCTTSVSGGDFNGDGKTDLLCNSQATPVALAGTGGFQADLLSTINNGMVGTITAGYAAATNFPSTNVTKQVVTSVTTNDGRSANVPITTYYYTEGRMEPKERRFLGFRTVKETPPCLPEEQPNSCPYTETTLRQDLPSAGKPEEVARRAGAAGTYLSRQTYAYVTSAPGVFPATSLLSEERNYSYGGGPSRNTKTTHLYGGAYGNRTQTTFWGEESSSGDETAILWDYAANQSAYIVGRVSRQRQFAGTTETPVELAKTEFLYDGAGTYTTPPTQGYVTKMRRYLEPGHRWVERTFGYDSYGNQTSVTEDNRTTSTTFDPTAHVFPRVVTNGASESETTEWDLLCGVPISRKDANDQVIEMQSDNLCRPTLTRWQATQALIEERTYNLTGNANTQNMRVETPGWGTLGDIYADTYFDGLGRTHETRRRGPTASDIVQTVGYNTRGLVASRSAPFYVGSPAYFTTYSYDGLDRLTVTHLPDGNQTTHAYPVWQETVTDEHGHAATTASDAYGRGILTQKEGIETHYTYDLLGRLTGMEDHLGNDWSWSFDTLGRNYQKTDPDAGTWTFNYFDSGLLQQQLDAALQPTSFTYDAAGRLAIKTTPAETVTITRGSQPNPPNYFNKGRVTTVQTTGGSGTRTLQIDYDAVGRAVRQQRTMDGQTFTSEKVYDTSGYLQKITYPTDPLGTLVVDPMEYDAAGRLYKIPEFVNSIEYDAAGRVTAQANANGTTTNRTYSPERGFLRTIATGTAPFGTNIQNLVYTPDEAGMITLVTSPFPNETWTYGYDAFHRLKTASGHSFDYDDIGRITANSFVAPGANIYAYPLPGQPRPHAPVTVAGGSMSYDNNGNLENGRGRTITWNADLLPSSVATGGVTTQFTYDGLGERLKKVTPTTTSIYPLGDDFEITNTVRTIYISVDGLGVVAKRVSDPSAPVG